VTEHGCGRVVEMNLPQVIIAPWIWGRKWSKLQTGLLWGSNVKRVVLQYGGRPDMKTVWHGKLLRRVSSHRTSCLKTGSLSSEYAYMAKRTTLSIEILKEHHSVCTTKPGRYSRLPWALYTGLGSTSGITWFECGANWCWKNQGWMLRGRRGGNER
jgi:hypothetical protein